MLGLLAIPALLGLALAFDVFSSDDAEEIDTETDKSGSDQDDDLIQITLSEDTPDFDGTEAKEHVEGNASDNTLLGRDGNDRLSGHDGNDTLDGGAGNDRIFCRGR